MLFAVLIAANLCFITFLTWPSVAPAWFQFDFSEKQKLNTELARFAQDNQQLRDQVAALKAAAAAHPLTTILATPTSKRVPLITDLLGNPKATALALNAFKISQWKRYGALFSIMQLPPGKLTALRDLLAEHDASVQDATSLARLAGLPVDKTQMAEIDREFDTAAVNLLGLDEAQVAEDAIRHPASWSEVSELQDRMQALNIPAMTPAQVSATLAVLRKNMQNLPSTSDPAAIDNFIQSKIRHNTTVVAQLAQVLSPEQSSVLAQKLNDNITSIRLYYCAASRDALEK